MCKVPPTAYIASQTDDLVGNRVDAKRLHQLAPGDALRAVSAVMLLLLLLLLPQMPMLFMGEEWNTTLLQRLSR
jgi:maltooligosyltrehalose trehalohydrolase